MLTLLSILEIWGWPNSGKHLRGVATPMGRALSTVERCKTELVSIFSMKHNLRFHFGEYVTSSSIHFLQSVLFLKLSTSFVSPQNKHPVSCFAKIILSPSTKISTGSLTLIPIVLLSSMGTTIRPSSSTFLTIPVALMIFPLFWIILFVLKSSSSQLAANKCYHTSKCQSTYHFYFM